jgi:hypothetical protein
MKQNEGSNDRMARFLIGVGILPLAFWGPQTPWAYLGLIPLVTGVIGFCPLYALLGINTCPLNRKN